MQNAAASAASVLVSAQISQTTLRSDPMGVVCGSNADMLFALDIIIRLHDVANVPRACLQLLLLCTYCSFSLAASDASCIFSIHGDRRGSGNVSSIVSASAACTGREAVQLQVAQSLIPYINNFTGQLAQSSP